MRLTRLLRLIIAVLSVGLVLAPVASAKPPLRLPSQIVDGAHAFSGQDLNHVTAAIDKLYADRHVRLWVVYVDTFGQQPEPWAQATLQASSLGANDALLAVATEDRAYAFLVGAEVAGRSAVDSLRHDAIEPALHSGSWAQAAIAAATGLGSPAPSGSTFHWVGLLIALAVIGSALAAVFWWSRRRRRHRRNADLSTAQHIDATDAAALTTVPLDTLEDLSKSVLVEVDNAVRTSDNELALAVGEFGDRDTAPFSTAVQNAKTAMAQAFSVRQILDDAVPETPQQRRDLLTQVVVSAARADKELETQRTAFHELRDLVINAPTRLESFTQQLVGLTARLDPTRQTLSRLRSQFTQTALAAVAGNVDAAQDRLAFADQNITAARALLTEAADSQAALANAIRAAESALGQAQRMLDAVDSAADDITHAVAALPDAVIDLQRGIAAADAIPPGPHYRALTAARSAAAQAVSHAQSSGTSDPFGAFTQLTAADAQLDKLLLIVADEAAARQRLKQSFDQALLAAQAEVRGVSDYIDTHRGSVGAPARTRLAEALRCLDTAQTTARTDLPSGIEQANAAADLLKQAQTLAADDVLARFGSGTGAELGGIIVGGLLSGAMRGGQSGGGWQSTSYGGSGGGFSGGGGRF